MTFTAGQTVRWLSTWSSPRGGAVNSMAPTGAHPLEFYTDPGTNRVHVPGGHPFTNSERVVFYGGTPPTSSPPIVEGTFYFVRDAIVGSFRVCGIAGGAAFDLQTPAESASCLVAGTIGAISGPAVVTVPSMSMRLVRNLPPVWIP